MTGIDREIVVRTELRVRESDNLLVVIDGLKRSTSGLVCPRQVAPRQERAEMIRPILRPEDFHRRFEQGDRLGVATDRHVGHREVHLDALNAARPLCLVGLKDLFIGCDRLGITAAVPEGPPSECRAPSGFGVVGAELRLVRGQDLAGHLDRLAVA